MTAPPGSLEFSGRRFVLVSPVLPPAPSGQSVAIGRLLDGVRLDSFCLVSSGHLDSLRSDADAEECRHELRRSRRLPEPRLWLVGWLAILFNAVFEIWSRARQISSIVREEDSDLIVACSGDLYDLPATRLASRRTGCPFVAYLFDDFVFQWSGARRRLAAWLAPGIVHSASSVLVPNEFLRNSYESRYDISPIVVNNPGPSAPMPRVAADSGRENDGGIVYTGSVYRAHFDAFHNLISALDAGANNRLVLHIYTSQSEQFLRQNGVAGSVVRVHPHVPQAGIREVLRRADVLFLPLAFRSPIPEIVATSSPGKIGDYLAAGRPILVHAPADSFLSWYFRTHGCGLVVDRDDQAALGEALEQILTDEETGLRVVAAAMERAATDFAADKIRRAFMSHLNDSTRAIS